VRQYSKGSEADLLQNTLVKPSLSFNIPNLDDLFAGFMRARKLGKTAVVATTHCDLIEDFSPTFLLRRVLKEMLRSQILTLRLQIAASSTMSALRREALKTTKS